MENYLIAFLKPVVGRDPYNNDLLSLVFLPLGDKCLKSESSHVSMDMEQASAETEGRKIILATFILTTDLVVEMLCKVIFRCHCNSFILKASFLDLEICEIFFKEASLATANHHYHWGLIDDQLEIPT